MKYLIAVLLLGLASTTQAATAWKDAFGVVTMIQDTYSNNELVAECNNRSKVCQYFIVEAKMTRTQLRALPTKENCIPDVVNASRENTGDLYGDIVKYMERGHVKVNHTELILSLIYTWNYIYSDYDDYEIEALYWNKASDCGAHDKGKIEV